MRQLTSIFLVMLASAARATSAIGDVSDLEAIVTDGSSAPVIGLTQPQVSTQVMQTTPTEFNKFNALYQKQWHATINATGHVKLLYGATSLAASGDAEQVAKSFLLGTHAMFGLKSDLGDLKLQHLDKTPARNHIRYQQQLNGIPVVGGQVIVHANPQGQVTMVQNDYVANVVLANTDGLMEDAAKQIALDDLFSIVGASNLLGAMKAEKQLIQTKGKYIYIWKISQAIKLGLWVYHIDAETGRILYKANVVETLKAGKGHAFVNNLSYLQGKYSSVPLKNLYVSGDGYGYTGGYLWGPRANVIDDNGNDAYSPLYSFLYSPYSSDSLEKDHFDATQTYYQINTISDWWSKNVVRKYSLVSPSYYFTNYMIPAYVNVVGLCNAFYSPNVDGAGNPGFAFGDDNSCSPGSIDFTNDSDVTRHEFAHAMMDWSGFNNQYNDGLSNHYGRSMGEGNADWYAFLYSKDPVIGEVVFYPGLRTLDNTQMYPRDVDEPVSGFPEEHYTGEIWGGYLYDVYRALKTKAIPYIYQSSYYFSATNGFVAGESDFYDAIYAQALAEQDMTGKLTSTAKAWGSMADRGLNAALRTPYANSTDYFGSGAAGADDSAYFYFNFPPATSLKTASNLLLSGDVHEYVINAAVGGLSLTATVTPKSNGLLNPVISLYTVGGSLLTSVSGIANAKTVLSYTGLSAGQYVVTVSGDATSPARGYYTFGVSVK